MSLKTSRLPAPLVAINLLFALVWCCSAEVGAQDAYLSVDVPSALNGTDVLPTQVVLHQYGSSSTIIATLPNGAPIGAIQVFEGDAMLFGVARPANLGGLQVEARDLVRWDGSDYTLYLSGEAVGIPTNAGIDALYTDQMARIVVSFTVPVELAGTLYTDSDLVRYDGGWESVWQAAVAGVPKNVSVSGVSLDVDGDIVLAFDVPAEVAGTTFSRGTVARWTGAGFETYASEVAWPKGTQQRGLSIPGSPSEDPAVFIFADGFETGDTSAW